MVGLPQEYANDEALLLWDVINGFRHLSCQLEPGVCIMLLEGVSALLAMDIATTWFFQSVFAIRPCVDAVSSQEACLTMLLLELNRFLKMLVNVRSKTTA